MVNYDTEHDTARIEFVSLGMFIIGMILDIKNAM